MLVGAAVPLSEVFEKCQELIQTRGSHQTQVMSAIVDMLKKYGGLQIRNLACIGGNLVTASPIADMNPILLAARSQLNIASADKSHRVLYLEQSFFSAYRKVALEPDEAFLCKNNFPCFVQVVLLLLISKFETLGSQLWSRGALVFGIALYYNINIWTHTYLGGRDNNWIVRVLKPELYRQFCTPYN